MAETKDQEKENLKLQRMRDFKESNKLLDQQIQTNKIQMSYLDKEIEAKRQDIAILENQQKIESNELDLQNRLIRFYLEQMNQKATKEVRASLHYLSRWRNSLTYPIWTSLS